MLEDTVESWCCLYSNQCMLIFSQANIESLNSTLYHLNIKFNGSIFCEDINCSCSQKHDGIGKFRNNIAGNKRRKQFFNLFLASNWTSHLADQIHRQLLFDLVISFEFCLEICHILVEENSCFVCLTFFLWLWTEFSEPNPSISRYSFKIGEVYWRFFLSS